MILYEKALSGSVRRLNPLFDTKYLLFEQSIL